MALSPSPASVSTCSSVSTHCGNRGVGAELWAPNVTTGLMDCRTSPGFCWGCPLHRSAAPWALANPSSFPKPLPLDSSSLVPTQLPRRSGPPTSAAVSWGGTMWEHRPQVPPRQPFCSPGARTTTGSASPGTWLAAWTPTSPRTCTASSGTERAPQRWALQPRSPGAQGPGWTVRGGAEGTKCHGPQGQVQAGQDGLHL